MDKLKPCPFCGSPKEGVRAIEQGHTWNALRRCDYRVCCLDCGASTVTHNEKGDAITAWNHRPPAHRLSLDDLFAMDGQPVYIQMGDGYQGWAIVTIDGIDNHSVSLDSPDFVGEYPDTDFYDMRYNDPDGYFGLHVLGWVVWDGEPMEDADGPD